MLVINLPKPARATVNLVATHRMTPALRADLNARVDLLLPRAARDHATLHTPHLRIKLPSIERLPIKERDRLSRNSRGEQKKCDKEAHDRKRTLLIEAVSNKPGPGATFLSDCLMSGSIGIPA
jgi:hypothetical protein